MMKPVPTLLLIAVLLVCSSCFETEPGPKTTVTALPEESSQDQSSDPQAAWLEKTAQEDGAIQTSSGLLYKVIKAGNGAKPGPTDTVEVHYEGKLIDGTIFDSSYARGQSISFPLNGVIPGWTEGLQLM
jgi:FKBP-type peptidyl-prolyl cis-trans isomerase FkpA/FKBP-type peptidyl-prolyl cis-trans isomerase FklB